MAKVRNLMEVEGRIKNLSFYTMEGCDQTIVRSKGGPCKYRIKNHPNFAVVRKNNVEWSGCTKLSGIIFRTLSGLFSLADYPVIGTLNAISKSIQAQDTEGEHGARGLYLTKYGKVLEGFAPNKRRIFEQIVSVLPEYSVDRETMSAELSIPAINPDYQLNNARNLPYFRFVVNLGFLPDLHIPEGYKTYEPYDKVCTYYCMEYKSEWHSTSSAVEAQSCRLAFDYFSWEELSPNHALILGIGLQFGQENVVKQIEAVKHSGAARLLKVF